MRGVIVYDKDIYLVGIELMIMVIRIFIFLATISFLRAMRV